MIKAIIRHHVSLSKLGLFIDAKLSFLNDTGDFHSFMRKVYHEIGLQYPKFFKMDDLSKLGFITAHVLLKQEGFEQLKENATALVLANSSSSLNTDEKYNETVSDIPSPNMFVYTLPNILMGEISIYHKFKGENTFFVQEHFDPAFFVTYITDLLRNNYAGRVIAGWVELDLEENYNSFMMEVVEGEEDNLLKFTTENINQIYKPENHGRIKRTTEIAANQAIKS